MRQLQREDVALSASCLWPYAPYEHLKVVIQITIWIIGLSVHLGNFPKAYLYCYEL